MFGQDIYKVYSNYSYECTVEMLGCMQIFPPMYFQLNNVPMWKGAYMIQKVSHNIKPGDITTTFTGVRQNKYAIPMANGDMIGFIGKDNTENYGSGTNESYENNVSSIYEYSSKETDTYEKLANINPEAYGKLTDRSRKNLLGVNKTLVTIFMNALNRYDRNVEVIEGLRSRETQEKYYKEGKSKTLC